MRDRRELANHVDFLHREVLTTDSNEGGGGRDKREKLRLFCGTKGVVDEVLRNVRNEATVISPGRDSVQKDNRIKH